MRGLPLLLLALLSCSKPDQAPPPPAASTTTTTTTATATATASATATATAAATAIPTATATAAATAIPTTTTTASADPAGADAGGACGKKPLPDCPMQKWMKDNTAAASEAGDLPTLAKALDKIVSMAPSGAGYDNWVSIAKDGAAAARAGNLEATRASCSGCHRQYKNKFKASELRARPLP